jgi:hypothetical protein
MVGSDEEGDFSLNISPVMLDDNAKYQCQVSAGVNGKLHGLLLPLLTNKLTKIDKSNHTKFVFFSFSSSFSTSSGMKI